MTLLNWKIRQVSSHPNIGRVPHFRPDLALIKVEDILRIQLLTKLVKGADYFSYIFSDGS